MNTMREKTTVTKPGETDLDRVPQSVAIFASGRGEALKRFLVDDGVGQGAGFWKLAQALSVHYSLEPMRNAGWMERWLVRRD